MGARILIIEDNAANVELMAYLLGAHGHGILIARDGAEGLDVALRERPDLILCDVQMPGMDGHEFVRRAKGEAALRAVPCIAVTALAMVGDREKGLAAGFDAYLTKPIEPESFVSEVEAHLHPGLRSIRRDKPQASQAPVRDGPASRCLLAVDNVQDNLDFVTSLFSRFGYRVITTRDASQAVRLAREHGPELVLSDVCMPLGDGFELLKAMKSDPATRPIPVVLITSTAVSEETRRKGLALGAAKVLFRPIEPQDLLREVQACLSRNAGE